MFLWNYRISFLFFTKLGKWGSLVREEPVHNEFFANFKPMLKKQAFFQAFSLIILIVFLALSFDKFAKIPFFFVEYLIFLTIFLFFSIREAYKKEKMKEIAQNAINLKDWRSSQIGSPIFSPTSCLHTLGTEKSEAILKNEDVAFDKSKGNEEKSEDANNFNNKVGKKKFENGMKNYV